MARYTMEHVLADLREMPAEIRRKLRPRLLQVTRPMVNRAKANAGWSRRIPGAIGLSVTKRGVLIRVNVTKAPHARPYEGISGNNRGGFFRHPVFGNRDNWVAQRERPFLLPAVRAHAAEVRPAIMRVVEEVARSRGFR
ncbi:MAG: hypothetical protein DIU75_016385 [Mycolicibacterium hassiacum]